MGQKKPLRVLVILVGSVENGLLKHPENESRIERALNLWFNSIGTSNQYAFIVPSGGFYSPGQYEPASTLMKNELVSRGISIEQIICEPCARNTNGQVICVRDLLQNWFVGITTHVTVVTDIQHALRVRLACKVYRLNNVHFESVWARVSLWERALEIGSLAYALCGRINALLSRCLPSVWSCS